MGFDEGSAAILHCATLFEGCLVIHQGITAEGVDTQGSDRLASDIKSVRNITNLMISTSMADEPSS
jgi:hypothetical protein